MTANQILDGLGTVGTKHADIRLKSPLSILLLLSFLSLLLLGVQL